MALGCLVPRRSSSPAGHGCCCGARLHATRPPAAGDSLWITLVWPASARGACGSDATAPRYARCRPPPRSRAGPVTSSPSWSRAASDMRPGSHVAYRCTTSILGSATPGAKRSLRRLSSAQHVAMRNPRRAGLRLTSRGCGVSRDTAREHDAAAVDEPQGHDVRRESRGRSRCGAAPTPAPRVARREAPGRHGGLGGRLEVAARRPPGARQVPVVDEHGVAATSGPASRGGALSRHRRNVIGCPPGTSRSRPRSRLERHVVGAARGRDHRRPALLFLPAALAPCHLRFPRS